MSVQQRGKRELNSAASFATSPQSLPRVRPTAAHAASHPVMIQVPWFTALYALRAVQVAELEAQLKAERALVRQLREHAATHAMVCLLSALLSPLLSIARSLLLSPNARLISVRVFKESSCSDIRIRR